MSKHAVDRPSRQAVFFKGVMVRRDSKGSFARRLNELAMELRYGRLSRARKRKVVWLKAIEAKRKLHAARAKAA